MVVSPASGRTIIHGGGATGYHATVGGSDATREAKVMVSGLFLHTYTTPT